MEWIYFEGSIYTLYCREGQWICFEGSVYTLYCRESQWSGSALRAVSILQGGPVEWICFEGSVYTARKGNGLDLI